MIARFLQGLTWGTLRAWCYINHPAPVSSARVNGCAGGGYQMYQVVLTQGTHAFVKAVSDINFCHRHGEGTRGFR